MGVSSTIKEFRSFILKANAIDLAIGVAIGGAFTAVVTSIVSGLFTPLIAAIFGKPDFSSLYFTINHSQILYGSVLNAIFTLLIVVTAVLGGFVALFVYFARRAAAVAAQAEPKASANL